MSTSTLEEPKYNFEVVKWFTIASVIYLVVGTLLGTFIASQLAFPDLNFDIPLPLAGYGLFIPTR